MKINSQRALALLEAPRFYTKDAGQGMRRYFGAPAFAAILEWEGDIVKNLSFSGELPHEWLLLLESMATLMVGKPASRWDQLTFRECEAFLRDRNSQPAFEEVPLEIEEAFKKILQWFKHFPRLNRGEEYAFSSEKGPFRNLKLTDKVRELKGFLNSPDIHQLYQGLPVPELVDVEELTVYLTVPYASEREKALFEELHSLGVEAFQEESLNFIPEA
jgi:hypothetical protein